MPTYEYKCLDCGKKFEQMQRMTDEPLDTCRFCQGSVKRLIGAGAGIIFKGSGFYCTDYRDSSNAPADTGKKEQEGTANKASADGSASDKDTSKTPAATS